MTTIFKCSRCGYENDSLILFKSHLKRKTECKPKLSNISFEEVKRQYEHLLKKQKQDKVDKHVEHHAEQPVEQHVDINKPLDAVANVADDPMYQAEEITHEPKRKRRKPLRSFGDEQKDFIKKESLLEHISDPLKGIQMVIKDIYFNKDHEENHTIKLLSDHKDVVEIHLDEGWVRKNKKRVFDKMIYLASDILEYNIPKKHWTGEFKNFIYSMGEVDNEDLLALIREELEDTIIKAT